MGRSTSILPEGISRYRVFSPLATRFSFHRAYELKRDADNAAELLRSGKVKFRVRVVPIKARGYAGTLFRYAVYRRGGRKR